MKLEKNPMSMRLYFQNINGLSTQNLSENWIDILYLMETNQVDMYGLAETNITWNPTIKNILFYKLRQHVSSNKNSVKLVSASCDDPTHGIYQPGGVCQVTVGKVAGRAGMSGSDPHGLGRWTYITLQGKEGRKVVVVTLYRLAQASQPLGHRTAYNQQFRLLRRQGKKKPLPKKQVCEDLLIQIKQWEKDSEIIIMVDANSSLHDPQWASFLNKARLYDLLGNKH